MKQKAYLAGPDVFFDNALEIARSQKLYCDHNNLIGLAPLDNEIPQAKSKSETAQAIVNANIKMIRECDLVIANLHNFRGTDKNPSCDSGTAWECGFAAALRKPIIAYTDSISSIPEELRHNLDYSIIGNFNDALFFYQNFETKSHPYRFPVIPTVINLNPKSQDICDADAFGSFMLGYAFGVGLKISYHINDKRSLIEKYGLVDRNGIKFEDFGMPVNIMMAVSHKLE